MLWVWLLSAFLFLSDGIETHAQEPLLVEALSKENTEEAVQASNEDEASLQEGGEGVFPKFIEKNWGELTEQTLKPLTLKAHLSKKKSLPLTLEQVLQLAEGKNIEIDIERQNAQKARMDFYLSLSELLPDIKPSYNQSRFVGGIQIFGGQTFDIFRTTIQPQVLGEYTIYPTGKNLFEVRASRQRQKAKKFLVEETRQAMLAQVATAFYDMQEAYWQRAIAQQGVKEAEAQLALNTAHYTHGIGLKLDMLQAKSNLATKKQALLTAESDVSKAAQSMSRLLNMDVTVDIVPQSLDIALPQAIPQDWTLTQMAEYALRHHPQVKKLERDVKASRADAWVTVMDFVPTVTVTGFMNWTGPKFNQLETGQFGGIAVETKILNNLGTQLPLEIIKARSTAKLSKLTLLQAQRVLEENINNALVELEAQGAQIQVAKEGLTASQEGYDHALGRKKAGVGSNVDLELAQTKLTEARSNMANSFLGYHKAYVQLLSTLGLMDIDTVVSGLTPQQIEEVRHAASR